MVTTALLGAWLGHGTHTDRVDTVIDARVQASLAGHPQLLEGLAWLGDQPAIIGMTAVLVLVCLLRRRYRGAALAAISVPAAAVITERLLKPLVGRTPPWVPQLSQRARDRHVCPGHCHHGAARGGTARTAGGAPRRGR